MEVDLKDLFYALLRKWYWLLLGLALGAGLGYFMYSQNSAPSYQTTAYLEVYTEHETGDNIGNDVAKLNYEHALIDTVLVVINSDKNLDRVADGVRHYYLQEGEDISADKIPAEGVITRQHVRSAVKATGGGDSKTLLITVSVTASSREAAVAYLNSYCVEATKIASSLNHGKDGIVLKATEAELPNFDTMDKDVTETLPSVKKNLLIGGVIGVAIGAVIVLLAFGLDKRVKSEAEIAERYNLPVLAVLPEISVRRDK